MKPLKIPELRSIYDMISLKGKISFITGGAGGIGRSCAAGFAEVGSDIVLMDVEAKKAILEENCKQITDRYGVRTFFVTGDVSDEASVIQMFDEVVEHFGTVDVVFSNAGIGAGDDSPGGMDILSWKKMININLTGMFLIDRTGAKIMKKHRHGGSIINTASMSGHIVNKMTRSAMDKHMVAYASAKAGVIQLTKSIAINYVQDNIRCNSISPGMILSGLHDNMDMSALNTYVQDSVPMNRFASLNEIMGIVVYLASDLSSYATGSDFVIDGGVTIW